MNPTELYDELALEFPAVWPQSPEWAWENVHDGKTSNLAAITDLLARCINSSEAVVIVHSEPGIGAMLPLERVASYIAEHVLKHEIQVADPHFTSFVSVSVHGVATSHGAVTQRAPRSPHGA